MIKAERREKIVELIKKKGQGTVSELASTFSVSEMTIRRDLQDLDEQGLVRRMHGGALEAKSRWNILEPPWMERLDENAVEKRRIARYVADLVEPEEKIFIGSGTTTYYVAEALIDHPALSKEFTIVTNALPVANLLAKNSDLNLIVVGGFLRRSEFSLIGHFAQTIFQDLHVNRVIIGMRGIHPEHGLTNDHPQELLTDRTILKTSDTVLVVADHTKFGFVASSLTAPVTAATTIVTTKEVAPEMAIAIEGRGVPVIKV